MQRTPTNGLSGPQTVVVDNSAGSGSAPGAPRPVESPRWELSGGLSPNTPVQRIPVATQPFTIGREFENSLCLAHPTISRRHAELLLVESDLLVRDLASRNGTYLNGRRVQSFERLQNGDMLQFGAAVFTIHPMTAAAQPPDRARDPQCHVPCRF